MDVGPWPGPPRWQRAPGKRSSASALQLRLGQSCRTAEARPPSVALTGAVAGESHVLQLRGKCAREGLAGRSPHSSTLGAPGSQAEVPGTAAPRRPVTQPSCPLLRDAAIFMHVAFLLLSLSVNLITHLINLWRSTAHILKSPCPSVSNEQEAC